MSRARLFTGATVLGPEPRPDDSVGVLDGEIVAVGDRPTVTAALPHDHEVVDCAGRTLVPGFVDAHLHPLPWCFFEHHEDLDEVTSLDEVFDRLADRAARVHAGIARRHPVLRARRHRGVGADHVEEGQQDPERRLAAGHRHRDLERCLQQGATLVEEDLGPAEIAEEMAHPWTAFHSIDDFPRLLNPPGGYIQNANNPPQFVSLRDPIDMSKYPSSFERGPLALRPQLALDLLESKEKFSVDDVIDVKYSTRMLLAERVKRDVIAAVREDPEAPEEARAGA